MKKYKIGYTVGVFDLFHVGHLNLLERCKAMCDTLVVGICDDNYVRDIKHKEPVVNENDRARIVKALKCVDEVMIVDYVETDDKMITWNKIHFDVLFSGDDWKGSERYKKTEEQFAKIGASIEYLPYTHGVSTSDIKNQIKK
jgi:glycerol-3-phosphate cytidylyltransferase